MLTFSYRDKTSGFLPNHIFNYKNFNYKIFKENENKKQFSCETTSMVKEELNGLQLNGLQIAPNDNNPFGKKLYLVLGTVIFGCSIYYFLYKKNKNIKIK